MLYPTESSKIIWVESVWEEMSQLLNLYRLLQNGLTILKHQMRCSGVVAMRLIFQSSRMWLSVGLMEKWWLLRVTKSLRCIPGCPSGTTISATSPATACLSCVLQSVGDLAWLITVSSSMTMQTEQAMNCLIEDISILPSDLVKLTDTSM